MRRVALVAALVVIVACDDRGEPANVAPTPPTPTPTAPTQGQYPYDSYEIVLNKGLNALRTAEGFAKLDITSAQKQVDVATRLVDLGRLTGNPNYYARAESVLDAIDQGRRGISWHVLRAGLHATLHEVDLADAVLTKAAAIPGAEDLSSALDLIRGDIAAQRGDFAEAQARYAAARAASQAPGAVVRLAMLYTQTGRGEDADAMFAGLLNQAAVSDGRQRAWLQTQQAKIDLERRDWDAADAHLAEATRFMPQWWLVDAQRVELATARGDNERARSLLEQVVRYNHAPQFKIALAGLVADNDRRATLLSEAAAETERRAAQHPRSAADHGLSTFLLMDPSDALRMVGDVK